MTNSPSLTIRKVTTMPLLAILLLTTISSTSNAFNIFEKIQQVISLDSNDLIPSLSETIHLDTLEADSPRLPFNQKNIQFNSSFVSRPHPYVINIPGQRTTACAAKFRSLSSRRINMWWEDGKGGQFQGALLPGQESTTNTYEGHVFFFTDMKDKTDIIFRVVITPDRSLYPIEDEKFPATQATIDQTRAEVRFNEEYLQNSHGVQWRHYYGPHGPRPPPMLYMLPAQAIGQQHTITTPFNHWYTHSPTSTSPDLSHSLPLPGNVKELQWIVLTIRSHWS
jgi:hypothetical protein